MTQRIGKLTLFAGGVGDLGADDRCQTFMFAGSQKRPQAVEIVGVGQCQAIIAQALGCETNLFDVRCPPHEGVAGSDG